MVKIGKVFKVPVPLGPYSLFEVYAEYAGEYKESASYEELGEGFLKEAAFPSYKAAKAYCFARGLIPVSVLVNPALAAPAYSEAGGWGARKAA